MDLGSNIAINVEHLGKRYLLSGPQFSYYTLRETLVDNLKSPWRLLKGAFRDTPGVPLAKDLWALRDVSLAIPQGEILGIIGRNGAGKTTLLKVLSRITEPTEGRVTLRGRVGSLLEVGTGFHHELSGRENIFLNGAILGMSRREIQSKFDEIVAFAGIEPFLDTPLKHYSTGMGARLAFAIAAHLDTDILLVDEVLAVGDLGFRKKCLVKMQDVTQAGLTVVFVSHDMNSIRRLCRRAVWLDQGRILAEGGVQEVVGQYEASFLDPQSRGNNRVERPHSPSSPKYFSWVSLTSQAGDPAAAFDFGDTLCLTLGMEGRSPHPTHFVEWFLSDLDQGNRVAWGASHALLKEDVPAAAQRIAFEIGPLPLTAGRYTFSFAMGVPGVVTLDLWPDAITFDMNGVDFNGNGYHYTTRYAPVIIPYHLKDY
jgi:lipopolysaccharide transport system ATP-binding protein